MKQRFEFDEVAPGLNGSDGLIREHYHAKKKRKDLYTWLIKAERPQKHEGKVVIDYTRQSVREPDVDNLYASFKHWGDSLVDAGVIIDDRPSIVDLRAHWEKAKNHKSAKTIIEIRDAS